MPVARPRLRRPDGRRGLAPRGVRAGPTWGRSRLPSTCSPRTTSRATTSRSPTCSAGTARGALGCTADGRGRLPRHRDPRLPDGRPRGHPVALERSRMEYMENGYQGDHLGNPLHRRRLRRSRNSPRAFPQDRELGFRQRGDLLAEQLLSRIATDENLHMVFYRNLLKSASSTSPDQAMREVLIRRYAFLVLLTLAIRNQLHT
ncbi:hypothetical protein ACU686_37010, partial [Yinghuangia aomiensis]